MIENTDIIVKGFILKYHPPEYLKKYRRNVIVHKREADRICHINLLQTGDYFNSLLITSKWLYKFNTIIKD